MAIVDKDARDASRLPCATSALRQYADAAVAAAMAVTHLGVIPGAAHVPLTSVKLRRYVQTADNPAKRGSLQPVGGRAPATAVEVMGLAEDCIILAGPGTGKSTLLRTALIDALATWPPTGPAVPVLINAKALTATGPIAADLAAAVAAESGGSREDAERPWDAEFFATAPLPGARWLVMVDGLNEITDAAQRRAVLRRLTAAAGVNQSVYRFVVTTRPLPDGELPQLPDWAACRYDLLDASETELETIAARWLAALNAAEDPYTAARRVVVGLDGQSKTPLTVALTCLLYARAVTAGEQWPGSHQPTGRFGLYAAAAEVLASHQAKGGVGRLRRGVHAVHPTFAEFRMACELTSDPVAGAAAFASMFGRPKKAWDPAALDWSYRSFLVAAWSAQSHQSDLADHLATGLCALAARRTLLGCQFIAALAADGITLAPSVVEATSAALLVLAAKRRGRNLVDRKEDFTIRSLAILTLGKLGDPRAADLAENLIAEATGASRQMFLASDMLTAYSPETVRNEEVRDLLSRFISSALDDLAKTADTGVSDYVGDEFEDTWQLRPGDIFGPLASLLRSAARDDPRGRDVRADDLAVRAADPEQSGYNRTTAATELARRKDPRAADLLIAVARAPKASRYNRQEAMVALAELGDPYAADLVIGSTGGNRPLGSSGLAVAKALQKAGSPRGMDLLWSIASTPADPQQWAAANEMAKYGDLRGKEQGQTGPVFLPRRPRPSGWRGWLGAGLLNILSVCGIATPFVGAFLLGLAFAGSGGSRPGPVNWIAFAFTLLVVVNLTLGGLVAFANAFVHSFRIRFRYLYATVGMNACLAATPLIIVAWAVNGLLPSGFHAIGHALWNVLILRF